MAPYINPVPRVVFPEASPRMQQHLNQLVDTVNSLAGHNGPIALNNALDLGGQGIQNVGAPAGDNDVVTQAFAQQNYSAAALRPQLEANGSNPLQSVRRLNDGNQREQSSSWLNTLSSTPPNATGAQVSFANGGSSTTVSINPTNLIRADGSVQPLMGKTDTIGYPSSYTITTIARTAGVVTATFAAAPGLSAGQTVGVSGVTDSSFDGQFTLTGAAGVTLTWAQGLANASSTGGSVSTAGVFYYYSKPGSTNLFREGGYGSDTPQNRIASSNDGKQIVAVVVVHGSGGVNAQSGGGGTPTTGDIAGGSFF